MSETGRREVTKAAAEAARAAPARAVLRAAYDGLAGGQPPPDWLVWPMVPHPLVRRLTELVAGQAPELLGVVCEALLAADTRRAHGAHYTPPELADEVVEHTLSPLLDQTATQHLTICDPCTGGGVFLLRAARFLAERWGVTPREVAERCLYGVDRDPLAAETTRAALWLLTGAVDLPRRIVAGDALVGRVRAGDRDAVWPVAPCHWHEAFAEVFGAGFDAVIGNPPFLGGSFLTGALGREYRDHLVEHLARRRGNADLCAYFFLRAEELLRPGGRCGLVATNTIAQGATRAVGLDQLLGRGTSVYRAESRRRWPGEAALCCSLVWFRKQAAEPGLLDGRPVARIAATLTAMAERDPPVRLPENSGLAFNGTKIYGQGFLLTPDEAAEWVADDPACAEVLQPYLSGDDLYGRPDRSPSRRVICFADWPLSRARRYPRCLERVERLVKPERDRLRGRNAIGDRRAEQWWQFGSYAPGLYAAIAGRATVLAKVLHSDTFAFVPVPADAVFSHGLCVFADDDPALLAILESTAHEVWARHFGSSLAEAHRYTLSKTFETFPLPARTKALRQLGRELAALRRALAAERDEGLTRLTVRYHDPAETATDIVAWRALHTRLDQAVASAYGWSELDLSPAFGDEGAGFRPAATSRDELLDRLWDLNHRRAGRLF